MYKQAIRLAFQLLLLRASAEKPKLVAVKEAVKVFSL